MFSSRLFFIRNFQQFRGLISPPHLNLLSKCRSVSSLTNSCHISPCVPKHSTRSISVTNVLLDDKSCWKCGQTISGTDIQCEKCKALYIPDTNVNLFTLLGLPQKYEIDQTLLADKVRNYQKLCHPDRYANSKDELEIAVELSALGNHAYSILHDPVKRGIYILKLNNVSFPEGTASEDTEFLSEMIDLNEEAEKASDLPTLQSLVTKTNANVEDLHIKVTKDFEDKNYDKAKGWLVKMRYYYNLRSLVKEKIFALTINQEVA